MRLRQKPMAGLRIMRSVARRLFLKPIYRISVRMTVDTCGPGLRVNGKSVVNFLTRLGTNVNLNGLQIIGGGPVTIGDNFHSGTGLKILTQNHNYDHGQSIPYDKTSIAKPVTIDDNVWVGINATILPGVSVGEGAVIQAGSVVVRDVEPLSIVGGSPAVHIKNRDSDHYFELKAQRRFF